MLEQATLTRGWSIEGFRMFWANPDPALIPRIRDICTDDIVGYWPKPIGKIKGEATYIAVIDAILRVCPDLVLSAEDYACSGDLHFVRWVATGSGPDGRFEFNGIDRIRTLADGRVCENYICSDGDLFARVAADLRAEGIHP
jgi:hypothetical protein